MKLLVITNDFPPAVGGIENYTYSLVCRWPSRSVTVLTRWMPGCDDFDDAQDFKIKREPVGTLIPTPALIEKVERMIIDEGIDVIHFPSGLPLGLMGPRLQVPYAVSVHGGEFLLARRLPVVRSLLKAVCRGAFVLLPESSFAEMLIKTLPGVKVPIRRVTCGVDPDRYGREAAPPVKLAASGPVIVSVCRLVARKGPRTLVKALPLIKRQHSTAHLLLVGGGPDASKLKAMAAENEVEDSVIFAGPQKWHDVPKFLSAGDVFALPTRPRFWGTEAEGLPLVLVEAAASGLPLVAGRSGGVEDAVREGVTGLLVEGDSPEDTAQAIVKILDDPGLARRMGQAGRAMVLKEFHWDSIADQFRQAMALASPT